MSIDMDDPKVQKDIEKLDMRDPEVQRIVDALNKEHQIKKEALLNRDFRTYFSVLLPNEMGDAFMKHHHKMDDETYWLIFAMVWQEEEFLKRAMCRGERFDLSKIKARKKRFWNFLNSKREGSFMDEKDKEAFEELPDVIKVYRGYSLDALKEGYCWTTDIETAKFFTERTKGSHYLSGYVKKKDIVAFLTGGENEIIVDPRKVFDRDDHDLVGTSEIMAERRKSSSHSEFDPAQNHIARQI